MNALRLPRLLAAGVLGLVSAWAIAPLAADAGGPKPRADFTIQTRETLNTWEGDTFGSWNMTGVEHDSGLVAGGQGYPRSTLWLEGDLGSMYIETVIIEGGDSLFEVLSATGVYESWVGAAGTYTIRFGHYGGEYDAYRDVRRKLEGFLPAAP